MFWFDYKNLLIEILDVPDIKLTKVNDSKKLGGFTGDGIYLKSYDITIDNLFSLAHEFYHYYQSLKMERFKDLVKNYIDVGKEGYDDQLLEMQAFYFQDQIMLNVFGIQVQYPRELPKSPSGISNERIRQVAKRYPDLKKEAFEALLKRPK